MTEIFACTELVEAFETTAADLVAANGGRLIKTLGDEVLYVADDAGTAAEIGLRLIETLSGDETMPELRVGIAFGAVTTRMGDVFGTTVNLASRLTSIAPKDTVLVDGVVREELTSAGEAPESEKESSEASAEEVKALRFAMRPLVRVAGEILGQEATCLMDAGAYAGETPAIGSIPQLVYPTAYRVGSVRYETRVLYTNTPPTGAFRGVCGPYVVESNLP